MAFSLPVIILGGIFAGFGGLAAMVGAGKRSEHGFDSASAIFQLDAGDLRLKDIHRLHGLQINMTGAVGGDAKFCIGTTEHTAVECVNGTITHAVPHRGLHHGNLSFPIPGLEKEVQGKWISVLGGAEDVEVNKDAELFDELVRKVRAREEHAKETAGLMGVLMQV